jgi:hypothetical protein
MYALVPSHNTGFGVFTVEINVPVNVVPQTSFTIGSVVGAVAAETHCTVLAIETGPPTSAGDVV